MLTAIVGIGILVAGGVLLYFLNEFNSLGPRFQRVRSNEDRKKFFEKCRTDAMNANNTKLLNELDLIDDLATKLDHKFQVFANKGCDRVWFSKNEKHLFLSHIEYFKQKCNELGYILGREDGGDWYNYYAKPK